MPGHFRFSARNVLMYPQPLRSRRTALRPRPLVLEPLETRQLLTPDMVLHWNEGLLDAVRLDRTASLISARPISFSHTPIDVALIPTGRTHAVYAVDVLAVPATSREAAVAAAAERA